MLHNLHVENLALIDETNVEFGPGLNILTGETGAGKSLLVGSINLALGAKADSELIRTGETSALVEMSFESEDSELFSLLEEMEIPVEGNFIEISRKIMQGRSVIKVNGETVNAKQLRSITELLLDIHGQHEHQSLLNPKKHLEILDAFAGASIDGLLSSMSETYKEYVAAKKEYEDNNLDEATRRRNKDLYEFELNEIDAAKLVSGEDEELENLFRKMANAKKIGDALTGVCALCGSDEEGSAGAGVGRALKELRGIASLDSELSAMESSLSDIEGMLHDFHREASGYLDGLEVDGETYYQTEQRLNVINHLKDKYGSSIDEILTYGDELREKIAAMDDYDSHMAALASKVSSLHKELVSLATEVSNTRQAKAKELQDALVVILKELSFPDVRFVVSVTQNEEPTALGFDNVEFLFSANVGESIRPLKDVASGGELSRVMLGIKTLLADKDAIDTLIFDEIDAGISGKTAWQVAGKLGELSKAHQVICITHLPQIAAKADNHFKINKDNDGVRTNTRIQKLDYDGSVLELARLLGSEDVTESALSNARELLEKAHNE